MKLKWQKLLIVISSCLMHFGCARLGHDFPIERAGEIENGKSTKDDVRRILGEPVHIGLLSDGSGWWGYQFVQSVAIGPVIDTKGKHFTVHFDSNGIVNRKSEIRTNKPPLRRTEIKSNTSAAKSPTTMPTPESGP